MDSPSRATRNVSIVDGGGINGSDQSPDGGDPVRSESGPTAIPVDEGDVSRQAKAAAGVAVLQAIPAASTGVNAGEEDGVTENDGDEHATDNNNEEEDDDGDNESEYSYTYEDEDETHYSGFLIPTDNPFNSSTTSGGEASAAPAAVEDTKNSEGTTSSSSSSSTQVNSISRTNSRMSDGRSTPSNAASVPETNPQEKQQKQMK